MRLYTIVLFFLVCGMWDETIAATPVREIKRLAEQHGEMVAFEVPGTTFDCLAPEDYKAMGPDTEAMHSINGVGCQAVINTWVGAEVSPDGLTWWFVAHGGHDAYGGNEAYRLDLTNARAWSLHSLPSPRLRYDVSKNGEVIFHELAQWRGCPERVKGMELSRQKTNARACTKYGPPASHTYSTQAFMNGKIYLRSVTSFGSNMVIHQGAWIFDPAKACIEADRASRITNLERLNPQNVTSNCDPAAAWTYLGQRNPGVITPLPTTNRVLYSWQKTSQGALEDGNGQVLRDSGAPGGTSPYASVRSQWIPSLQIGVINKLAKRWFYVTAEGEVRSPSGKQGNGAFARVNTSAAAKRLVGHFSYDPKSGDFLILEGTDLFRIARDDLEDDDVAEIAPTDLDWSNIRDPLPEPYNGFVYIESADVHCMMNRGNIGEQFLMCFRYR